MSLYLHPLILHPTCSPHTRSEVITSSHPPPNSRPSKNATAVCTETAQGTAARQKYAPLIFLRRSNSHLRWLNTPRVRFPRLKAPPFSSSSRQLYSRFLRPKARQGSPCPHFGQRVRDRMSQCYDVVNNGEPAAHQTPRRAPERISDFPAPAHTSDCTARALREGYSCGTSTVPCPPANAAHSWSTQPNS
ncbi:uncharacterized protein SCHCODRAFT_02625179 [Schizophyllum commune H4-8]|uniref:uncharacterized protein n=1 Tax=Schizophyllum commune (strain H4-8 / FGSC 9210) TaxID=578458 RepID=UPI00215EE186|nr:uncharacterized protein SCHCODRAFT_02625179 [Schizophyllum commune H4-8]KAI5892062.1 hypothetical protein SCHCODRAFT_02625179 [Schizophyllum commune H4-8]